MSAELNSLTARANRHAALADPARLRIVELLALGDRSPSELQRRLGTTSNLLAHHLGVLERAGMISRSTSEGDRRRSYLRLVPEALEDLVPGAHASAQRIVFICTGNSARSPIAVALWQQLSPVPAVSAGTEPAAATAPGAIATAERHGLSLAGHTPRAVSEVLRQDDFMITVCDRAHERLPDVALHWSVPNPTPKGTAAAYEATYDQLARRVGRLAEHLTAA